MNKNILKRSLIVGIIMLFLSTICLPVLASEALPDLIVEQIGFSQKKIYDPWEAYATIRNIGNASIEGSDFHLEYVFTRKVFGIIPIIVRIDTVEITQFGGLEPGAFLAFDNIGRVRDLPKLGFFEFKCTVNPQKTMEESDYDNNDLAQNYIVVFGRWNGKGGM